MTYLEELEYFDHPGTVEGELDDPNLGVAGLLAEGLADGIESIAPRAGGAAVYGAEEIVMHLSSGEHAVERPLPEKQRRFVLKSFFDRNILDDLSKRADRPSATAAYEEYILSQFREPNFN